MLSLNGQGSRDVMPYLSPANFRIFAHRGSTEGGAIENTYKAFEFASKNGLVFMETDIQATADGAAVIFHDKDAVRILGVNRKISELSLHQLQALASDKGFQVPTLREILVRFPNLKFNIDFKSDEAVEPGIEAIRNTKAQDRVLVSSFSRRRRLRALELLPHVATSADAITLLMIWITYQLRLEALFKRLCDSIQAIQIPVRFGLIRFDNQGFINAVSELGVEVHFWTVNEYQQALQLHRMGARGIVTDQSKMMYERFRADRIEIT